MGKIADSSFSYRFILMYMIFSLAFFTITTLMAPLFPSVFPQDVQDKLKSLSASNNNINPGLYGLIQLISNYISIFSVMLTINSTIGIVNMVFLILDIVCLFIIMPHIADFIKPFTDLLAGILSNQIVGTIVALGIVVTIFTLLINFLGVLPSPNPQTLLNASFNNITVCEDCINAGGRWVWCDGVLNPWKQIIGCVPTGIPLTPGDITSNFNKSCGTAVWEADKLTEASPSLSVHGSSSCAAFNLQFSMFK